MPSSPIPPRTAKEEWLCYVAALRGDDGPFQAFAARLLLIMVIALVCLLGWFWLWLLA